ncbi:MAG TPA: TIGR02281 family clan AA aspartic protease [Dongiaceae bacterium]
MRGWVWLLVVVVLGGVVLLAAQAVPGTTADAAHGGDKQMRLIYLLVILAALSTGVAARLQAKPGSTLAHIGAWVLIFAAVIMVYSFRNDVGALQDRFLAELVPGRGQTVEGGGAVAFPRDEDGHYHVYATADGAEIPFMIDTGATDVVLTPADARLMGLDPARLDYTRVADTANGQVRGAPILINNFKLGPITVQSLPAVVNEADMPISLLGMEFLNRLKSYRVEDDRLTLQQ